MVTKNNDTALRLSVLFAAVLIGVDLVVDLLLLNLPLPSNVALRLMAFKEIPLVIGCVGWFYFILRREFERRAAARG